MPLDPYTPCAPRSMDAWRHRAEPGPLVFHTPLIQRLSAYISLQEDRFATLARNLDVDFEPHDSLVCAEDVSEFSDEGKYNVSSPHFRQGNIDPIPNPPQPRPGRLSPTVLQMVLSPNNISIFSEASSGADTSYDSGLYRWLGVRESSILESSPRPFRFSKQSLDTNGFEPDLSVLSSRSAYSQPSPVSSPASLITFPLSPPPTVRPPFTESLHRDEADVKRDHSDDLKSMSSAGVQFSYLPRSEEVAKEYSMIQVFNDFAPLVLKNMSLQHYLPSATVLRHFQRVIDELRGKYTPNDQENNAPTPSRSHVNRKEAAPTSLRSSHGSYSPRPLHYRASQTADMTSIHFDSPSRPGESKPSATREMYTEMAGILFEQVEQDEAQVDTLRLLVERLHTLAQKKRKTALLICTRGRGKSEQLAPH